MGFRNTILKHSKRKTLPLASPMLCCALRSRGRPQRLANGALIHRDPCILHPSSYREPRICERVRMELQRSPDPTAIMGVRPTVRDSTKRKFGGRANQRAHPRHTSPYLGPTTRHSLLHLGFNDDHHRPREAGAAMSVKCVASFAVGLFCVLRNESGCRRLERIVVRSWNIQPCLDV